MRLQVFLSHSGACSRRRALAWIQEGHVTVNARCVREPSFLVEPSDQIALDGRPIRLPRKIYILLHKPKATVSTVRDPHASKTVLDILPEPLRQGLHPVGRLDKDTTGLLLLTNDGTLTHRLSHPAHQVEKTYHVLLNKDLADHDMRRISAGVLLEGQKTRPCRIKKMGPCRAEIILSEGRKRQIRKVLSLFHYHVEALTRVREGSLELGRLREGEWRFLDEGEVRRLYEELGISPERKRPS